jgi:hypothetical protein
MRTSGAPAGGPLTYIPFIVGLAMLLALFGGPSSTLRTIDGMLRNVAVTLADTVKAALQML